MWLLILSPKHATKRNIGTDIKQVPDLSGTRGKVVAKMAKMFTAEKGENKKHEGKQKQNVSNRATKENDQRDKAWCPFQRC